MLLFCSQLPCILAVETTTTRTSATSSWFVFWWLLVFFIFMVFLSSCFIWQNPDFFYYDDWTGTYYVYRGDPYGGPHRVVRPVATGKSSASNPPNLSSSLRVGDANV
jgi:hypothetical protein